jgi:hypothetical protein
MENAHFLTNVIAWMDGMDLIAKFLLVKNRAITENVFLLKHANATRVSDFPLNFF